MTNIDLPSDAPIVEPGVTLRSVSWEVADCVLRPRAPRWWWIGFGISLALLLTLFVAVAWLFINGIGVWGVEVPVAWGLAIAEYVWWIALASGGTIVSALFYLTRSPWRSATNRIAETMLLGAAACAGIMPIMHLGRPSFFYWLFPYPNVMGVWPQVRSPLWWDFICLLCYILMSIMFYYVGLLPDVATVRDLAQHRRQQIFYGILALGWRGAARHWHSYQTIYYIMCAIMAPMVISVHSVVGLDFAGGLTPGWHSTQFSPYFFFGAVISGVGAGHHADDPGSARLRAPGHHHRIPSERAGQGHAHRQRDARLRLPLGRVGADLRQQHRRPNRFARHSARTIRSILLGEGGAQHHHPAAFVVAARAPQRNPAVSDLARHHRRHVAGTL
jgi:hypothetical protein